MEFTSLRLSGFKSFVDPTELVIAPGLTGVVGPNGCGKSNLLEALRWVMGESRSSMMRGDGMEDVIFAGAASRSARNHAEVALRLDNRDRRAPSGFNDDDRLDVVRRIVREAGSVYRLNGREVRARDVAMLFADAATGAHSPSLVRQGQIAELIAARPRARRRVLEDAAGIAGLYQRRHEAELRLRATEVNLERVGDVLEALEAQRATLARQARQAQRYRAIAEGLRRTEALLLLRLWHDAEMDRVAAAGSLSEAVRAAARTQAEAGGALRARELAATELPGRREEDAVAAAILQRLKVERERLDAESADAARRIAELEAAAAQLDADRARETALDRDAAETVARLSSEATELARAGEGHAEALSAAHAAAEAAVAALDAVQSGFDARADVVARLTAEREAAERALEAAREQAVALSTRLEKAEAALGIARAEAAAAEQGRKAAAACATAAMAAAAAAETAVGCAEAEAAAARVADAAARPALAEAEGAARGLAAEAAGLERLLARPADAVAQMLDAVRVEPGFEAALGAALGEDLAWPELDAAGSGSGWTPLPSQDAVPLPPGAEPLASRATAPPALARRLAAVGLVPRADGKALQTALVPGARLVSREGDLWRWDGLQVAAGAQPSAAALRLQQLNRLDTITVARADAEARLTAARAAQAQAAEAAGTAAAAETAARATRREADRTAAEAERAQAQAQTAADARAARAEAFAHDCAERREARDAALAAAEAAEGVAAASADPAEARVALEVERLRLEAARLTMLTRRAEEGERVREAAARERRLEEISGETGGWRARAATAAARLAGLDARAGETATALVAARERPEALGSRRRELTAAATEADARREAAAEALAAAEAALRGAEAQARAAERAAGEAREGQARAEALADAAAERAEAAEARLRGEAEAAPEALLAHYDVTPADLPPAQALEAEAAGLRHQREGLGAVNLRAEEDARAVAEEAETLAQERAEIEAAIAKLRQGIGALNREGRGRLLSAFQTVNGNFGALFEHLFGGGEARLELVESDDPLEAGLEIMCQPPGKKLSTLSLLSGGEQSLTALSLIFAVFLANPSPICVLDEVDAPLDDANVARFCDLLDEMTQRTRTRFLIITHHAVTMARMDRLFGVTMVEPGVSQLVSVDLAGAERMVEPVA